MDPAKPSREAVRMEVERIGASAEFKSTPRLREFLQFITDEALAGREGQIKEYSIGIAVYRKHPSYDPRLDSTVRVEAVKLRSRLSLYYEGSGSDDQIRISVPKGAYVPHFGIVPPSVTQPVESRCTLPSVAVLPFLNLSPDPEDEYFCDGLVEELTAALTGSGMMRVAPRSAALRFKGMHPELAEVRRALNIDRVLEGSVRKHGDRLRITVQLVDIPGCCQLWSQTYDRSLPDIFAIQEEIGQQVVALVCGGKGQGSIRRYTPATEAFDLYLRGRHLVGRWDVEAVQRASALFEQAIAADPAYPLPYVGVAAATVCLATMGFAPPADLLLRVNAALDRALQLDSGLAEAHAARATVLARHEQDWAAAEREYRLAIQLAPGLAQTHHEYATEFLAPNGRFAEAHAESRRARELDPFSPAVAYGRPWILIHQRRFLESEQEFRELLASGAVYEAERIGLAFAVMGQGRYGECLDEYQKIAGCFPSPASECIYTWMLALAGEIGEACRRLSQLEAVSSTRFVPASYLAAVHFALGNVDRGFELLEQAVVQKEAAVRSFKEGFDWDPVRPDPRFQALVRRLWPEP